MEFLLFEENTGVREKLAFFLESRYHCKVIEAPTLYDAIRTLKQHPGIQVVLFDFNKVSKEEYEKFFGAAIGIPLLVFTENKNIELPKLGTFVGVVERSDFLIGVPQILDDLLSRGIIPFDTRTYIYCRIRTKLLLAVYPLKGDIFIRLSEVKYLKLFHKGDCFEVDDLEKYTFKKGVDYLYIRKEDTNEFVEKLTLELKKALASPTVKYEKFEKLSEAVLETTRELNTQIGFTQEVQELAKVQVGLTLKMMGSDPDLKSILDKIARSNSEYLSAHSVLCANLACALAAHMKWGSEATFQKLTLAALLHDVTLANAQLAEVSGLDELDEKSGKFTAEEIKAYKEHPTHAGELVSKMTKIPRDVDTIVRQHHERPDGGGFPRGLSHTYISPLSCVFIVAHELTDYVLKTKKDFNIDEFIAQGTTKYKSGHFKRILNCVKASTQGGDPH
jgi:HD-GYP domain-containing protein (c-di-GMP phosphodiesterase class II)